jgi:hypothetical protein
MPIAIDNITYVQDGKPAKFDSESWYRESHSYFSTAETPAAVNRNRGYLRRTVKKPMVAGLVMQDAAAAHSKAW